MARDYGDRVRFLAGVEAGAGPRAQA